MFTLPHLFRHTPPPEPDDELIHWDEDFSVGNGLLDNEHRDIVRVLNTLYHHQLRGGPPLDGEALLARVRETVSVHFANEEDVLARHHCPMLTKHQTAHAALLQDLADLTTALPGLTAAAALAALARLIRRIVVDHILVDDMDCREYLRE
ncbi:MAG: bacteriohemerythrin [Bacteroidota bacterium]